MRKGRQRANTQLVLYKNYYTFFISTTITSFILISTFRLGKVFSEKNISRKQTLKNISFHSVLRLGRTIKKFKEQAQVE